LSNRSLNQLKPADRAVHDWYKFVLMFPPHLVRSYQEEFGLQPGSTLLDPFAGTGTTLVEGLKLGCNVVGFEASPMARLAATVKTNWSINPHELLARCGDCANQALRSSDRATELRKLSPEAEVLLLKSSICQRPLHKALILAEVIDSGLNGALKQAAQVALATTLVRSASNLHFGPEVGVRGWKEDGDVIGDWMGRVQAMCADIASLPRSGTAKVYQHDARSPLAALPPGSIDAVFTSPPYPNEKDYTRTTRLESVVLGMITNKQELRALKKQLVRSNTRGVYSGDEDDLSIAGNERIEAICHEIEARRIALGKTSGFERLYARVTRLYFGGMVRHLAWLRSALKPGARLGYVVGDQASYLQVMIRTGEILAELSEGLGYTVVRRDLFRERFATATRSNLREEVVILQWS
jgi:hypothetical protein